MTARATPTIRDVAARAGVSIATASRSLNDKGLTSPATLERVRAAAVEIGFRPNRAGRALKTARTGIVGVLLPSLRNPVFADAVAGVEIAANAAGYGVIVASSGYDFEREAGTVETLIGHGVDGLILTVADPARSAALKRLRERGLAYALIYNQSGGAGEACAVSVDNRLAAAEVAERMIAKGHLRLAMLAGEFAESDRQGLRREGFVAAALAAGLDEPPVIETPFQARRVGPALARLFGNETRPTALFCATDILAIAAIRELGELGLDVPRDVSVVGFDGIGLGELTRPSLASVVQPSGALGETAFSVLKDRIDGRGARGAILLDFHFRPGESLGPAPTQGDRQ
jgi:DNA-binding LacI/PurR family transcriptional regulator